MPEFSLTILYVESPATSAAFYRALLGQEPIEQSETFAMFPLREGAALGLWSRHTVEPRAMATSGGAEIVFTAPDPDAVHAAWRDRGLRIAQPPTEMDFGRTFVALDPDGHRLRVFRPGS
jgi:catechol 2,3-dioxygenase-like lactoylglutathione lyase family enzyme